MSKKEAVVSKNLWQSEVLVEKDRNLIFSEIEPYETYTSDLGKLFLSNQKEYGRCVSKQYTEAEDGSSVQNGWVFQKRSRYTDYSGTYLQETWVTVWAKPPERIPEHWEGGEYAFA